MKFKFVFAVALFTSAAIAAEPTVERVADEPPIADVDREHWSFQVPTRPMLPEVKQANWCQTPIDRFILARLEQEGLSPQPPPDRATLARRLSFDLTGLPPVELNDNIAYSALVESLLASPAYGERQAQHWLDLARFAETDGYEHDYTRPTAWKYRDWVINALNDDLPYDQFIRLQLAGDELKANDATTANDAATIATGFLLAGPDMPDLNLKDERRHMVLNEMTSTVGAVFLGLQIGCAQCHDHKYEPLSQADFYRLRAVFEPAALFDSHTLGRVVVDKSGPWPDAHLMVRGDFRRPGPVVEPAVPRVADPFNTRITSDSSSNSSGRRSQLAAWLTRPNHPLTARLIVNRIWQEHFGYGLCRQASDFGVMGEEPTHPELLDWLATELVRMNWSLKSLHRLIVSSAVYQQSSRPLDEAAWRAAKERDPENRNLARMNRRRLDGESIRDTMLLASERLNPARGGPGVMPPLPEELVASLLKNQWKVSPDESDHRRRSIYLFVRRNLRYPLFEAFDRPDAQQSCERRNRSTIAPQALVLLNSEFVQEQAAELARHIASHSTSDPANQIKLIYERCLGRVPTEREIAAGQKFLSAGKSTERLADYCLAMFNLNEFVYVD